MLRFGNWQGMVNRDYAFHFTPAASAVKRRMGARAVGPDASRDAVHSPYDGSNAAFAMTGFHGRSFQDTNTPAAWNGSPFRICSAASTEGAS